jgi:hypothetical protein
MRGLTIHDEIKHNGHTFLAVTLVEILDLIKAELGNTEWELTGVECIGSDPGVEEWHWLSDNHVRVSTDRLLDLAATPMQMIDGRFKGYRPGETRHWLLIGAVDGAFYEVYSESPDILEPIKQHFKKVKQLPDYY